MDELPHHEMGMMERDAQEAERAREEAMRRADMTIVDVVMKLIGPVEPAGDTMVDEGRYINLVELLKLAQHLHMKIDGIAARATDPRFSVNRAAKLCAEYLHDLDESRKDD